MLWSLPTGDTTKLREVACLVGVLVEDVAARDLQACRGEIVLIVPHMVWSPTSMLASIGMQETSVIALRE